LPGHRTRAPSTVCARSCARPTRPIRLADAFDAPLGDRTTPIGQSLHGSSSTRAAIRETWDDVRGYLVDVLDWAAPDTGEAKELAVIPASTKCSRCRHKEFATSATTTLVVSTARRRPRRSACSRSRTCSLYMDRLFDTQRG